MEIKPQYEHSKFGTFMFNLCAYFTYFIKDKPALFKILSHTWGIILTAIGWIISGILYLASKVIPNIEIKKYHWIFYISIGPKDWGGLEFGNFFMIDNNESNSIKEHEFAHAVQNCLLGPLFIFLIWVPSWFRYWCGTKKPYNAYWPEDAANQCGKYLVNYLEQNNKEIK